MHAHCLRTALYGNGLTARETDERIKVLETLASEGRCPRCGGEQSEWPDSSHAISDMCLKICNPCGQEEAIAQFSGRGKIPPISGWATLQ